MAKLSKLKSIVASIWGKFRLWVTFFAVAATAFALRGSWSCFGKAKVISEDVISLAAIAVGFLATLKALIISVDDRPVFVALKKNGIYRELIDRFVSAIWWCLWLVAISIVIRFFDLPEKSDSNRWTSVALAGLASVWWGLLVASGYSTCLCIKRFTTLITWDTRR